MELIKRDDRFDLYNEDGHKIASTLKGCVNKLSLKNCQEIECGYDLDELAKEKYPYEKTEMFSCFELDCKQEGFIEGAKTILEILGDKKYSEEDIRKAILFGEDNTDITSSDNLPTEEVNKFIQSLQQTEWDVSFNPEEKDSDGCLILKRL